MKKKLLSVMLAIIMVFGLSVTAFGLVPPPSTTWDTEAEESALEKIADYDNSVTQFEHWIISEKVSDGVFMIILFDEVINTGQQYPTFRVDDGHNSNFIKASTYQGSGVWSDFTSSVYGSGAYYNNASMQWGNRLPIYSTVPTWQTIPFNTDYDPVDYLQTHNFDTSLFYNTVDEWEEYVKVHSPMKGSMSILKTVNYIYSYRVETGADYEIELTDMSQNLLSESSNVKSFSIDTSNVMLDSTDNDYTIGYVVATVTYNDTFTGSEGTMLMLYNNDNGYMYNEICPVQILAFTDTDLDGLDDSTGESNVAVGGGGGGSWGDENAEEIFDTTPPDSTTYSDDMVGSIRYGFDTLMYWLTLPLAFIGNGLNYILNWFTNASTWITSISSFFAQLFGYLPSEIVGAMSMLVMATVIFSIFKLFRG